MDERGRFGKKTRELDRSSTSKEHIKAWRCAWQYAANLALVEAESTARIDCRSHREAGRVKIAKKHLGPRDAALVKQGYRPAAHKWNAAVGELEVVSAEIERLENEPPGVHAPPHVGVAPVQMASSTPVMQRTTPKASRRRSAASRVRHAKAHRGAHQKL